MPKSYFDSLNHFIQKRYRWIIIAWIVAVLISLVLIPSFFSSVSYDLTGGFGSPPNSEADKAANIVSAQFPTTNASSQSILIVIQNAIVYSDALKQSVLALNQTLSKDSNIANYSGQESLYSLEASLLNESLPDIISQTGSLQSNIASINSGLYILEDNLSSLSTNLFQLQSGLNQTAQLVYGIPTAFVGVWQGIEAQGVTDTNMANAETNATTFSITSNFGGDAQSIAYYSAFFSAWESSFQSLPNSTSVPDRETFAINQAVTAFLNNPQLDTQTSQTLSLVAFGLNVTTWSQSDAIANLTISAMAQSIPADVSASLGASPAILVNELYNLGPSPSNATLGTYSISVLEASYSNMTAGNAGFSVSDLMQSAYQLGPTHSEAQTWQLACDLIANATQQTFANSPLFSINSQALSNLLFELSPNATASEVNQAIDNIVTKQPYENYPYAPSTSLTGNFVNSQNNTMLVVLTFSSSPSDNTIAQVQSDVKNSNLQTLGTVYVTGGPVLTKDVAQAFIPALEITVGPGIGISLLIVGLLFLAPLAAFIPVLLGGISVSVALAAIYAAIVKIGHGNLTFLTPTLTILLMLGLAVDYSVLQLRRTKEERQKGKTIKESVGISIKWAGQAVLTAGITVIVAYIVMAIANVPIFSDVGTAIALGVAILLAASLTLLPALEIALGDKIFWPGINKKAETGNKLDKSKLRNFGNGTLKRKVPIIIIISVIALGAFAVMYNTPTSEEFLKLIPNFQSNQGLTVLSNSFGSGTMTPTSIIVTTSTPIIYGNNQFNQTLLNQIEKITASAAASNGITAVTGITRPFGNVFNYSAIDDLALPTQMQYEGQMFSTIGKDNKTAVITVNLASSGFSSTAIDSLKGMEKNINQLPLLNGVTVNYGGETQATYDSQTFMGNLIPEVVIILAAAVYVILFLQLRSAFTPIRLIITILCSVVFSLAITSAIFYNALNLPILDFGPLFVVVTMLGVGIDYDIFFLTRIREEVLNGKTDNEAIVTAIEKVWVTILGLGLVLATVFLSLMVTNIAVLAEISLAVAAAILIDVTVVILLFVPSLMGLAQRLNWWPYKLSKTKETEATEK
ncbi:MAG TPA: MMPL family transporter [Candidatus Nanoarchaeia archaeon]|nr:MMPL family transporter [Candidatus Nanoarchaeia archaeon]